MKLEISRQIFEKYSNIKFHENPCGGSRSVPCRQTNGQTDVMKPIVAFRNFAQASKDYLPRKVKESTGCTHYKESCSFRSSFLWSFLDARHLQLVAELAMTCPPLIVLPDVSVREQSRSASCLHNKTQSQSKSESRHWMWTDATSCRTVMLMLRRCHVATYMAAVPLQKLDLPFTA
jgi:hypothetical protein